MHPIPYLRKNISKIDTNNILADVIEYEISEEDMNLLASQQTPDYEIKRFALYKDWGSFELIVDNIEAGKIIQGGLKDGHYILAQYLVYKGINELLLLLSMTEDLH